MKRTLLISTLALGALVLGACKFQATTTINPDGSGELRSEVGFSADERANLIQQGNAKASDFCNASQPQRPQTTVTEEQRGDETWCVTASRFASLNDLRRLYEQKKGLAINRLEIADAKLYYDIDVDTLSKDSSFSGFNAITWKVIVPGTPLDHNADLTGDKSLEWTLKPRSGVAKLRFASTVENPPPGLGPLIIAGLVVLLAGVTAGSVIGFALARRSRRAPPG